MNLKMADVLTLEAFAQLVGARGRARFNGTAGTFDPMLGRSVSAGSTGKTEAKVAGMLKAGRNYAEPILSFWTAII